MQGTKELIHKIGKIFEMGLQDEYLLRSINRIIGYEKEKTMQEVRFLKEDLASFERNYSMSSKDFFSKFERRELGDEEDFFEWSAIFQMHRRSKERLRILEEIP